MPWLKPPPWARNLLCHRVGPWGSLGFPGMAEAGLCAQQMDEIGAKLGEQPRSLGDKWDVE